MSVRSGGLDVGPDVGDEGGDGGGGDEGGGGEGGESTSISVSSSISMSIEMACVGGGIPSRNLGGERGIGSNPCERKRFHRRRESSMSCCFRFNQRGEEDGEWVEVVSGERDDEREEVGDEGEEDNECKFQTILRCTIVPNSKSAINCFVFLGLLDLISLSLPFSGWGCFRD